MSGGGGGGNTTTTQKADPWKGLQPYLKEGYADFATSARDIAPFYGEQTYAGFTPWQTAGQEFMTDYAQSLAPTQAGHMNAMNWGMNAVMDPYSNQALQSHIAAAQRPLTQAYQEQVLPGIRDQAEMYGGAGSRTGLAEGVAARSYMDAMGDVSSSMMSQAYGQGLDQQARMMAMAPQMYQAGAMPGQFMGQVGAQQQAMEQQGIDEAMARHYYGYDADYARQKDYLSTLAGTPWGTTSVTGPDPNATNTAMSTLGGGLMGLGAYGALGAAPLAAANPWMWGAIGAGALAGNLFT